MRPRKVVLVLTERSGLRFMLRITARLNVIGADTLSEFERELTDASVIELAIVDSRDSSEMAHQALSSLNRIRPGLRSVLIAGTMPREDLTDRFDHIVREYVHDRGMHDRLLEVVKILLARKRGPRKGSHHYMPVMRSLMGVECAQCRAAGHRCQAQMWLEGRALCLRCADDEPCIFVTAAQLSEAEPVDTDPCSVPAPSRDDLRALRSMPALPSIHATTNVDDHLKIDDSVKAAILADAGLSSAELVAKYHLAKQAIWHILRQHRRRLRDQARRALEVSLGSPGSPGEP